MAESTAPSVLSVRRLRVHLRPERGSPWPGKDLVRAVEFFDLDLLEGEALAVMGESGCGKSVLARTLAGLECAVSGSVRLRGQEVLDGAGDDRAGWHAQVQLIGQVPLAGVSPRAKAETVLGEAIKSHAPELARDQRAARLEALLGQVDLQASDVARRVRELTPLEAFRVALARAVACAPRVLICDAPGETFSFEDRKAVLDLLLEARRDNPFALLLTGLDARPWRGLIDRAVSMYMGRVVEQGDSRAMFDAPAHPYTRALLASELQLAAKRRGRQQASLRVPGAAANPAHPPLGCVFHPRCPMADAACVREVPHLRRSGRSPLHYAACLFAPTGDVEDSEQPAAPH